MRNVEQLIIAVPAVVGLTIAANWVAQIVYPTLTSDSFGRRIGYNAVTRLIAVGLIGAFALIAWMFGFIR